MAADRGCTWALAKLAEAPPAAGACPRRNRSGRASVRSSKPSARPLPGSSRCFRTPKPNCATRSPRSRRTRSARTTIRSSHSREPRWPNSSRRRKSGPRRTPEGDRRARAAAQAVADGWSTPSCSRSSRTRDRHPTRRSPSSCVRCTSPSRRCRSRPAGWCRRCARRTSAVSGASSSSGASSKRPACSSTATSISRNRSPARRGGSRRT